MVGYRRPFYRDAKTLSGVGSGSAALPRLGERQNPQEVREKTAEATAEAKSDVKAVADGIREGWNRNKPLDLNAASRDQLMSLPGMNAHDADRVIAGRP